MDVPPNILARGRVKREGEKVETIKFPKSAIRMFQEMRRRHDMEINIALRELYGELGILDRLENKNKTGEQVVLDPKCTYIEFITPPPPEEEDDGKEELPSATE